MKLTNTLLIILICLISYKQFSKQKSNINSVKENNAIIIRPRKTRSIIPEVKNKNAIKHSTTLRNYLDTDGRNITGINHNIRVGKDYYISGGITTRESSYNSHEVSGQISITKYW